MRLYYGRENLSPGGADLFDGRVARWTGFPSEAAARTLTMATTGLSW
jgi:hypothetical protein